MTGAPGHPSPADRPRDRSRQTARRATRLESLARLRPTLSPTWWLSTLWLKPEECSFQTFLGGPSLRRLDESVEQADRSRKADHAFWTRHPELLRRVTTPWPSCDNDLRLRAGPPLSGCLFAFLPDGRLIGGILRSAPWIDPRHRGCGHGGAIMYAAYRRRFWRFNFPGGYSPAGLNAMRAAWNRARKSADNGALPKEKANR